MKELANDNPQNLHRVRHLIAGFIRQTLSEKEEDELDEWVSASNENLLLFEELIDEENLEDSLRFLDQLDPAAARKRLKSRIRFKKKQSNINLLYAVAAILTLAVGIFVFMLLSKKSDDNKPGLTTTEKPAIVPGTNKATLRCADGSQISLSDAAVGILHNEAGARITKTDSGEIVYTQLKDASRGNSNTLTTPRGGQFRLILPDGSKVTLNAASSLEYPPAFIGSERLVKLTGEAYFEVTRNTSMPFRVELENGTRIEVLGTEFNVMNYPDESAMQTTLIEGAVKISYQGERVQLKPGQQLISTANSPFTIDNTPDIEQATSWKHGNFDFKNAPIETIMRQIARWYDVDIVYKDPVSFNFNADISRNESVSKVLRLLEKTNRVHFKIENKTIYVFQ